MSFTEFALSVSVIWLAVSAAAHLRRGVGIPVLVGDDGDIDGSNHLAGYDEESGVR